MPKVLFLQSDDCLKSRIKACFARIHPEVVLARLRMSECLCCLVELEVFIGPGRAVLGSRVSDSYLGVFRLSGVLPDIVLALSEVNCLSEEHVAEVVNNRFFQGGLSKHVNLGTEIVGDGQDARNVSTIEIILERLK